MLIVGVHSRIMDIYYWMLCFLVCVDIVLGSQCEFPPEWRGRWHEGRRTEISANSISRKGTCIQRDGNKFFMLNKDSSNKKCFKCLVFTQWHPNLLQYKESLCWYQESFHHVCGLINGDAILYTLVRAPSTPQPCPFHGSYTFSYTNGTMTTLPCESPVSEVRACADESKFKFIFKHCSGVPGTYNTEMSFQCLATWENGEKYLYGSFSLPWMTNVDEYKYRCFMHSFYGTNGDMSMSADPTCQGLQSPTLGIISMRFTKDLDEPRGTGRFPDVLVHRNRWRDLSGKWLLEVESGLQVLRLKQRPGDVDITDVKYRQSQGSSSTKLVIRCVEKLHQVKSLDGNTLETEYLTYVTDDTCESGYQCVKLTKRDANILEMYLGDLVNSTTTRCGEKHFAQAAKHVLIPDVNDSGQCSITRRGIYSYQDKASECTGTVNIGCETPNQITIATMCPTYNTDIRHTERVEILNCLHSWTMDSKTYIIIQSSGQTAKCLTFVDTEYGVELQSDDTCQTDRWKVTSQYLNYLLYSPPDSCTKVDTDIQADENVKKGGDKSKPEGHVDISSASRTSVWWFSYLSLCLVLRITLWPR